MSVRQISPRQLQQALASPHPPVLIDVRTPDEHTKVALPHARLWPLQELQEFQGEFEALRGQQVVVYCHHGIRSLHAAAFLQSQGIDAASLTGGIERYAQEIDPSLPRY